MSNLNEDKLKEKLLQEVKASTPDLWNKIESNLSPNKIEAAKQRKKKPLYIKTFSSIAAALTLIIGISLFIKTQNTLPDTALKNEESLDIEKAPDSGDEKINNGPVNYESLNFSEGLTPAEKYPSKNEDITSSSLNIIPFSEDLLGDMTWMGKVTILDAYYKDYKYDTFSDKFEPNGRIHNWLRTIVYEVKVEDIYLEDDKINSGDTFKIEQQCFNGCYLTDSASFDMKINHQYILPLFYAGDKILYAGSLDLENFAEGDINRDGKYSIVYPFAPQIEVTLDNEYIFHSEWESLLNDKTVDIIMPTDNAEESFYDDKMKLRRDNNFISDLNALIKRYK